MRRLAADAETVEYIQVKSSEPDKLWSVADMCANRTDSLCAKSLARDRFKEISQFRIVTLRAVTSKLSMLTYPCYGPGRETSCGAFAKLSAAMQGKLPDLVSQKGNGIDYWLEHCLWEVRHDDDNIRRANLLRIMRLAAKQGVVLLPEQAETIEDELRSWAYDAGRAFWIPDKAKKIISRADMRFMVERQVGFDNRRSFIYLWRQTSGKNGRCKAVRRSDKNGLGTAPRLCASGSYTPLHE